MAPAAKRPRQALAHGLGRPLRASTRSRFSPAAEEARRPLPRHQRQGARGRVSGRGHGVTARLDINRWNRNNVDDVWEDRNIDPDKADNVVAVEACSVDTVNDQPGRGAARREDQRACTRR